MSKLKWCFVVLFSMCFLLMGCYYQQSSEKKREMKVIEYETKIAGGKSDKNVIMMYYSEQNEAEIETEFEEKQIPFDLKLTIGTGVFQGEYKIVGSLEQGSISVSILSLEGKEYETFSYNAGKIENKAWFDFGPGEYILRVVFQEAKNGKINLKFNTQPL